MGNSSSILKNDIKTVSKWTMDDRNERLVFGWIRTTYNKLQTNTPTNKKK